MGSFSFFFFFYMYIQHLHGHSIGKAIMNTELSLFIQYIPVSKPSDIKSINGHDIEIGHFRYNVPEVLLYTYRTVSGSGFL